MPSPLDGGIQKWVGQGLKAGKMLLDVTIHREAATSGWTPSGGSAATEPADIPVPACGFPDGATGRFLRDTGLRAGEVLIVLAQAPLRARGLGVSDKDSITIRGNRWKLLEVTEDPAQGLYVCKAAK